MTQKALKRVPFLVRKIGCMCGCSTRRTYKVIVPHLRTSIVFAQQSRTKNPKAPAKVLFWFYKCVACAVAVQEGLTK